LKLFFSYLNHLFMDTNMSIIVKVGRVKLCTRSDILFLTNHITWVVTCSSNSVSLTHPEMLLLLDVLVVTVTVTWAWIHSGRRRDGERGLTVAFFYGPRRIWVKSLHLENGVWIKIRTLLIFMEDQLEFSWVFSLMII